MLLYLASEPERQEEVGSATVPDVIEQIRSHSDAVYVALSGGTLLRYSRGADGSWSLKDPYCLSLGSDPVSSLLPINNCMYAACGKKVWVLNAYSGEIQVIEYMYYLWLYLLLKISNFSKLLFNKVLLQ